MRVYDSRRRLLGTAGVLSTGPELLGELWLAMPRTMTVVSELEAPGIRGIHRTSHRLVPPPKWTAYWVAVVDPLELELRLGPMAPLARAIQSSVLREAGLGVNPRASTADDARDHVRFLQQGRDAIRVERTLGIPVSPLAWIAGGEGEGEVPPTRVLTTLAGSGVSMIAHPAQEATAEIIQLGLGTHLLAVGMPRRAWGAETGVEIDITTMEQRIGGWLTDRSAEDGPVDRTVMLISDDLGSVVRAHSNIDAWNRRYAYPRFVIGAPERRHFSSAPVASVPVASRFEIPGTAERIRLAQADTERRRQHAASVFAPLVRALDASTTRFTTAIAAAIGSAVPGTVVFNPSPFLRTDHVIQPDGQILLARDVPPLGYAYLVDLPDGPRPSPLHGITAPFAAHTDAMSLELNESTGAIVSIIDVEGTQWVGTGLNDVAGSRLDRVQRQELPQVGVRLLIKRWAPSLGAFTTTITLYTSRPWVDIANTTDAASDRTPEFRFDFGGTPSQALWELPGGVESRFAPIPPTKHLRWIHLWGTQNVFFRALDAPWFSVDEGGTLISHAPTGPSRYRFACDTLPATAADAARLGWSAEPLVIMQARGGAGALPRWGSLFQLDQLSAAIVGVTDVGAAKATLLIQELSGANRTLSLGGDLLQFRSAEVVDFLDRPIAGAASGAHGGVTFPIRGHGFAAVRLSGLTIR